VNTGVSGPWRHVSAQRCREKRISRLVSGSGRSFLIGPAQTSATKALTYEPHHVVSVTPSKSNFPRVPGSLPETSSDIVGAWKQDIVACIGLGREKFTSV
jgi:hypothetical protein